MPLDHSQYPTYSRPERIVDGTLHVVGVFSALLGALLLWRVLPNQGSGGQAFGLIVYSTALIATFSASACYHMTPWEHWRAPLRRIDHAAIYLKIAGTYTPFVILIGSISSFLILALVWGLAVFGMIQKLFFWDTPGRFGTALYLIMGWLSVTLVWSVWPILPGTTLALMAAGGLLYTFGVVFFNWENLRFSLAIWHGFVLLASACFYAAIATGLSQAVV